MRVVFRSCLLASVAVALAVAQSAGPDVHWVQLSSRTGGLPVPGDSTQQTGSLVAKIDPRGGTDFILSFRQAAPALVWYRHTPTGWSRYVIEKELLPIEAGGAAYDIDGDGDLDIVFGGDYRSNELWWWENPSPNFDPNVPWKRHVIKNSGANQHHDQIFADVKHTGKPQLIFWNQKAKTLFLAEIPKDPRNSGPWPLEVIYSGQAGEGGKNALPYAEGLDAIDVDGDGLVDLLAGNYWFKYSGGRFQPVRVGTIGGRIKGGHFQPGKTAQIVIAPGDGSGPLRIYQADGDPMQPTSWKGRDLLDREMIHGHTLDIGDINGDGHLDIFAAEMAKWTERATVPDNPKATAWILYGDGRGNFQPTVFTTGDGWHEGRLGDFDGDGRLDILNKPYNWDTPRVDLWLNKPAARSKFIPTYCILYGKPKNARPAEETAKFDMLVSSFSRANARLWAKDGRNSWQALKSLNPNLVIVVYAMGPGEYNTAEWGQIGEGWDWLKQHHGNESEDRWTARGLRFGTYLESRDYHNERLMDIGKEGWQDYWMRNIYEDYWGGRKGIDLNGVDGVFSDNTSYAVPWAGRWYKEGSPEQSDNPMEYFLDGKYLQDRWQQNVNVFFNRAIPFFRGKGLQFVHNFESLGRHADWWRSIDSLPTAAFAAMDEGGFICPWGKAPQRFFTWDWEARVKSIRDLRNVRALVNGHAVVPEGEGLAKMDVPDSTGMTGWDALWFSITSFLLGFDDVRRNAYMNFTVWSYSGYYWFDEFDPHYLHLGKAVGEYHPEGAIYLREFEDGFVVVNPGTKDAKDLPSPVKGVRLINHANFRAADDVPAVSSFDLPAHRGAILLKPGHKIGDEDNAR